MPTIWLEDHYPSAQANMSRDQDLLREHQAGDRVFRFYLWPRPGITLTEKKPLPHKLEHLDCGYRLSGGGIVFHNPGDLVFSIICELDDPAFPGRLKEKMSMFSQLFITALAPKISIQTAGPESKSDLAFCMGYSNPHCPDHSGHHQDQSPGKNRANRSALHNALLKK